MYEMSMPRGAGGQQRKGSGDEGNCGENTAHHGKEGNPQLEGSPMRSNANNFSPKSEENRGRKGQSDDREAAAAVGGEKATGREREREQEAERAKAEDNRKPRAGGGRERGGVQVFPTDPSPTTMIFTSWPILDC